MFRDFGFVSVAFNQKLVESRLCYAELTGTCVLLQMYLSNLGGIAEWRINFGTSLGDEKTKRAVRRKKSADFAVSLVGLVFFNFLVTDSPGSTASGAGCPSPLSVARSSPRKIGTV